MWSNATWAAQRKNWKIRCRRCDLPVETSELDNMAAIIAEHTQQVRELTQRIGDLVQQVNQRDAVIEGIRTALHVDFI
jgi:chromosome segregation ATPase